MNIAELFVSLGVKGADQSVKALSGIRTSLTDVSSTGLAAKAAVVAVIYAVEQLTVAAGQMGASLQQFSNFTGKSSETLQQWQQALMTTGVQGDKVTQTIQSLQSQMTKYRLGLGPPPAGLGMLSRVVGFDPQKADDVFYVMDKLKEYAKTEKNVPMANAMLESFGGMTPDMIAGLRSMKVDPYKLKAPMSPGEIAQLNRINNEWMRFTQTLKLFSAHFASEYGLEAIHALENAFKFIGGVTKGIEKLTKLIPELKVVAVAAGVAIGLAWAPLTTIMAGIIYLMSEWQKHSDKKASVFDKLENINTKGFQSLLGGINPMDFINTPEDSVAPKVSPASTGVGTKNTNTNHHTTVNVHGVEGAKDVAPEVGKAVTGAYYQYAARTQVA